MNVATNSIDGVLVIDKPRGLTSHDVVAAARRALGERRIGHTGTLDPLATGVLPLACGRATRLVRFLTASEKEYAATIQFGVTTDSYDVTGAETSRSGLRPERDSVTRALASLTGSYLQLPPAYSAKKVDGRRAYALARAAKPVVLTPAPVTVMRTELVELVDDLARVRLTCSAGFYVRSFAHSLGELTGTGACLQDLRRTRSGDFTLTQAVDMETLVRNGEAVRAAVIRVDDLLASLPLITLSDDDRNRVAHGQAIEVPTPSPSEWVRLADRHGHLVAMARPGSRPGSLHPAVVLI